MTASAISQFFRLSATIHHVAGGTGRDEYGNVVTGETTSTARCYLAQQTRAEVGVDLVPVERWTACFDPGTDIDADDVVTIAGQDYQAVGNPWPVVHPATGHVDHVEVTMERTG